VDYLESVGMKNIAIHEHELSDYAVSKLGDLDEVTVYGPVDGRSRCGIVSFNIVNKGESVDSHIVADMLNREGIAVRAGGHCAHPLMKSMNIEGTLRVSFYVYNSKDEIDRFAAALENIVHEKLIL
jgi:cysteine desulfurase / selenocysteine lyase